MRRAVPLALMLMASPALGVPSNYVGFELGADNDGATSGTLCTAELDPDGQVFSSPRARCARPCATDGDCTGGAVCISEWGYCEGSFGSDCDEDDDCAGSDACMLPFGAVITPEVPPHYGGNRFALSIKSDPFQARDVAFPVRFNAAGTSIGTGIACWSMRYDGYCSTDPSRGCDENADCGAGTCRGIEGEVTIAALRESGGDDQCVMTLGCAPGSETCSAAQPKGRRHLRVYYGDPTQRECDSSFQDGSTCVGSCSNSASEICDPVGENECPAEESGAPKCRKAEYVRSQELTFGEWNRVCLEWGYTPGDNKYECALYVGPIVNAETESGVFEIGRKDLPQGECSGGDEDGFACGVDGDCDGGGTCIEPVGHDVGAPVELVLGAIGNANIAAGASLNLWLDDISVHDLTAYPADAAKAPHRRWVTLQVDGDSGSDDCTNSEQASDAACTGSARWECVNDSGENRCDAQGSRIICQGTDTETFTLSNQPSLPACAGTGPCIDTDAWVTAACAGRENSANSGSDKTMGLSFMLGASGDTATTYDLEQGAVYEDDYIAWPPHIADTDPPGTDTTWTPTNIDALLLRLSHVGDDTFAARTRVTGCVAGATYSLPQKEIARVLRDVNGGGVTVTFFEDSRLDNAPFESVITQRVSSSVDNLIFCSAGGRKCADFTQNASAIADGTANNAQIKCEVIKGAAANADYILGGCGANDFVWNYPGELGTCRGGANDGGSCVDPKGRPLATQTAAFGIQQPIEICVAGTQVGGNCSRVCNGGTNDASPCTTSAECTGGGVCTRVTCPLGGFCAPSSMAHVGCTWPLATPCRKAICGRCSNDSTRPCNLDSECVGGGACDNVATPVTECDQRQTTHCWKNPVFDLDSCPGGYCAQRTQVAYVTDQWEQMATTWSARTGAAELKMGWHLPYNPRAGFAWGCQEEDFAAQRNWGRAWTLEKGFGWVDSHGALFSNTVGGDTDTALQDNVHLNSTGSEIVGGNFADCLLGVPGQHDCRSFYATCDDDTDCTAQANTTCQSWPGTAQKYCLG